MILMKPTQTKVLFLSKRISLRQKSLTVQLTVCFFFLSLVQAVAVDYVQEASVLSGALAEQNEILVKGMVSDASGAPLPGVTVVVAGSTKGVITDVDGKFEISIAPAGKLIFSFIGMSDQTIEVNNRTLINVILQQKSEELDDVTIVAFGKQKKESVIASIETVKVEDLRLPSSNLSTALAGRMSGMISYQRGGEPGRDNATYFIRGVASFGTGKVDPLILIDNVESDSHDLSRIHPDDLQSFSILKDASATALYGARGANGVILITTKEGKEGKASISARYESSFSSPTRTVELADPVTYMEMYNEAVRTRDPLQPIPFTQEKIDKTKAGNNPLLYPTVDWMDMLFKDVTHNNRASINIRGGGKVASYFVSGAFSNENGIMKSDPYQKFDNNISLKKFNLRSNVNVNLTKTTEMKVRFNGTFDDYQGPIPGGSKLYQNALRTSPVRFHPTYEPVGEFKGISHVLFGNFGEGANYYNPYAEMVKGYKASSTNRIMAQVEFHQELDFITKGLDLRFIGNTQRNYSYSFSRSFNPFYYQINAYSYDEKTGEYDLAILNETTGTEYLDYSQGDKKTAHAYYGELALSYDRNFKVHHVSGMLVGAIRESLTGNATTLIAALPHRNLSLAGRFTYGFDSRYLVELNFGYNGSEKFDKGHRWGFFPSAGLGWVVSNESFWQGNIKNIISMLKIRGTYGYVGNDAIGSERFFYLSNVNMGEGGSYSFGSDFGGLSGSGISIGHYENPTVGWEIAQKSNLALEIGLFEGRLNVTPEVFYETRDNILQTRSDIPNTTGLWSTPKANIGSAENYGFDSSLDYNHSINPDLWFTFRGNFTFARGKYTVYEEPDFSYETGSGTPWRSKVGRGIKQQEGYVAERLFIDDADVANSPHQEFGTYGPGDIKYKDINKDEIINGLDKVPIGKPTTPEINYGFGLSVGYKQFDFSFFFQGSALSSFWLNPTQMTPFREATVDSKTIETGLAKFIADDYWSESNQNPQAAWPRLSATRLSNNTQTSTMWMHDGAFLRLKNMEIGYELPREMTQKVKLKSCRFYFSGSNLLCFSKFKLWDVEMGGNGLGYPIQRVLNLGVNVSF